MQDSTASGILFSQRLHKECLHWSPRIVLTEHWSYGRWGVYMHIKSIGFPCVEITSTVKYRSLDHTTTHPTYTSSIEGVPLKLAFAGPLKLAGLVFLGVQIALILQEFEMNHFFLYTTWNSSNFYRYFPPDLGLEIDGHKFVELGTALITQRSNCSILSS